MGEFPSYRWIDWGLSELCRLFLWIHCFVLIQWFAVAHQSSLRLNWDFRHLFFSVSFIVSVPLDFDVCIERTTSRITLKGKRRADSPVKDGWRASCSCCSTFFSSRSSSEANRAVPLPARAIPSTRWCEALLPSPVYIAINTLQSKDEKSGLPKANTREWPLSWRMREITWSAFDTYTKRINSVIWCWILPYTNLSIG